MAEFSLTSSAFADGAAIPHRHSCDGEDRSPPLMWSTPVGYGNSDVSCELRFTSTVGSVL
jgi:hypothetical protein